MAYSDNFPATRPVFQADFANGGKIDPRATFSRSDTASSGDWNASTNSPGLADGSGTANQYYRVSVGGTQDLGSGSITYAVGDYVKYSGSVWFKTTQPIGVTYWSNEKHLSSENLFKYSSDLATGWVNDEVTFTAGQTAPDGGSDAFKVTETSATNEHRAYPNGAVTTDGGSTTFSGYFKYIGRQWIVVRLNDGSAYRRVWFDIQNGVVGTTNTGITASIAASGNGYYKVVATIATSGTSYLPLFGGASADNVYVYAGSGADAFYVWGLQYNHNVGSVLNETSGSIHREYAPSLKYVTPATGGQPRFEYDPSADGQSIAKGILIEGQSTNLLNRSEEFDNAYWQKNRTTVQLNAGVSPAGDLTADLVTADTTGADESHNVLNGYTFTSGETYTFSVFAKAHGTILKVRLRAGNTGTWPADSTFTLSGSGSFASDVGTASIESCGNGWYRCSVTATANASATTGRMISLVGPSGSMTFDGDSYSGIFLWGAQFEESSHPSSYLKVEGSTATRALESLSVTTADIGYTGGPVSIVAEGEGGRGDYPRLFSMGDSSSYLSFFRYSSAASAATAYKFWVYDSGNQQANLNEEASVTRVAVSVDTNSVKSCGNGGAVQSDTAAVMPVLSGLQIGDQPTGGKQWNGHIKRIALYGEALSDANLVSLTS